MKARCSLAVVFAASLLWSCNDRAPEGSADRSDRSTRPESAEPRSAADSSSKRPAEAVAASPTAGSANAISPAALAPSEGGGRPPDGLSRDLSRAAASRPVASPGAPDGSADALDSTAPSPLAAARARQAAGSLESPADFQRLAESVREKYALEAAEDPAAQLQSLLDRFEQGDLGAALPIGLFLAYGDASLADPARAAEFFRVASDNGEPRGFAELGRLSLTGRGLPEDASAAEALFAQAMAAGDPEGAFLLATGNRLELFPDADPASYRDLLEAAASLGHPSAANSIFLLAQEGQLDLADYPEMEQWLLKGAETGSLASLRSLADFYQSSGQSDKSSVALELAAESGSLDALLGLLSTSAGRALRGDSASRSKLKALIAPHAASNTPQAPRAQLLLAYIEAYDGGDSNARAILENADRARFDPRIGVALDLIESGRDPRAAILEAASMTSEQAYVAQTRDWFRGEGQSGPAVVSAPMPEIPAELRAEARRGSVVVEIAVDASGAVTGARVVSSDHPALSAAAVKAASGWKFEPAISEGQPVSSIVRMPFLFEPEP